MCDTYWVSPVNDMKNILETCNIKQLVSDYLYTKFN